MGDGSPPDDEPQSTESSTGDSRSGGPPSDRSSSGESEPTDGGATTTGEAEAREEGQAERPSADEDTDDVGQEGGGRSLLDELLVGLAIAGVVAVLLFAVSGVWPPLVAVESPSMEPNLHRGDLVLVAEEHRFSSPAAVADTGVVSARVGERVGYESFGGSGDVVVYFRNGKDRTTPVIHRAQFWVNDSENWYDKADPAYVRGEDCEAVPNCPAPHAGFVTRGDHNDRYDQVAGVSDPVRPSWIKGTAEYKVPILGRVRLALGWLAPGEPGTGVAARLASGA